MRRRFVGIELKDSYYKQAAENLHAIGKQGDLFFATPTVDAEADAAA